MKSIKKVFTSLSDWIEDKIRKACGSLSKDMRVIIVVVMIVGFSVASIYMTYSGIYNIGKNDAERRFLEIEHIKRLELEKKDSINSEFILRYENKEK